MGKIGKSSIEFQKVYIKGEAVVTGPLEKQGPLGNYFDYSFSDIHCQSKSWEKAEMRLLEEAFKRSLTKSNLQEQQIDYFIGGDLNNQIAVTSYAIRETYIPYIGTFAACSTLTENLALGAIFIENQLATNLACLTSSHNATSERQFRYPTEYGGQKPESMTFTATASGSCILSSDWSDLKITRATIGKIIDVGLKDPQDMGRAMAPAAVETLKDHLNDFQISPDEYDVILTGDLSTYGSDIFEKSCQAVGIDLKDKHLDAGKMLYDIENQNVFAGGSGCGCVTAALLGYFLKQLQNRTYKKILVLATGALLNPVMIAQKESIPCISHAICIERNEYHELH